VERVPDGIAHLLVARAPGDVLPSDDVAAVERAYVFVEESVAQLAGGGQPRVDEPQLHVVRAEAGQSLAGVVAGLGFFLAEEKSRLLAVKTGSLRRLSITIEKWW
jgi:hypothetical protein